MEADFSGWATKANLKCTDGRTIMPNAFQHQDKVKVPLVWQHAHNEPTNVLGYAVLEHRNEGVYAHGYFNSTTQGQSAKTLVQHGDIDKLSIYANQLVEKAKQVLHGQIREVSLVLAGANPGARIENVNIAHSDGDVEELEDEAIIYTGLALEHSDEDPVEVSENADETVDDSTDSPAEDESTDDSGSDNSTDEDENLEHADDSSDNSDDETVGDIYNAMSEKQKEVVHYMIGQALETADASNSAEHSDDNEDSLTHQEGTEDMTRNLFENNGGTQTAARPTLSHSQLETIVSDAQKLGSFKESVLAHAQEYGIEDIDVLFPDAKSISQQPDFISRRMEWVQDVIAGTKHSPFSRIKSTAADITADEARAKGYVKGNKKKEEIIKLLKRVTTPTTIYKKQKLDRDDIVDITDLDVVAWLKAEMRLMLDEELARAVLIGDGREPDDEDKIDEDHLRPIAYDDDMYAAKVTLPSNASSRDVTEAIIRARSGYKGSGTPTLYTTDSILTDLLLQEDKIGRRLYADDVALAAALRVAKIVPVEVMEDTPDLFAVIVNLVDYTMGADSGGAVSMFDDFDIDYNQFKYLIETRVSGALTKPKSAIVIQRAAGTSVTPNTPSFDGTTNTITIPTQAGVVYTINGATVTGDQVITETTDVEAAPADGYSFPHNVNDNWTYVYNEPSGS